MPSKPTIKGIKNEQAHMRMVALGSMLVDGLDGIKALEDYIIKQDADNWSLLKRTAIGQNKDDNNVWFNIGRSYALTEDLTGFMKKCVDKYKNENK